VFDSIHFVAAFHENLVKAREALQRIGEKTQIARHALSATLAEMRAELRAQTHSSGLPPSRCTSLYCMMVLSRRCHFNGY
jgi:hypothetical protein